MNAEREKYKNTIEDTKQAVEQRKQTKEVGKINIDYEGMIAKKSAEEKQQLMSGPRHLTLEYDSVYFYL